MWIPTSLVHCIGHPATIHCAGWNNFVCGRIAFHEKRPDTDGTSHCKGLDWLCWNGRKFKRWIANNIMNMLLFIMFVSFSKWSFNLVFVPYTWFIIFISFSLIASRKSNLSAKRAYTYTNEKSQTRNTQWGQLTQEIFSNAQYIVINKYQASIKYICGFVENFLLPEYDLRFGTKILRDKSLSTIEISDENKLYYTESTR